MASAALSSDHVNYLIFRYLQEAGHESTANAFASDWHRNPEFRDPEDYPFAGAVRRGELVNVIQDGLHHDELVSRVKKDTRKFRFVHTASREAAEGRERDGAGMENGASGSRPSSSSAKRKSRPPVMRPPDEFPTPAPKRQRRSEGSEGLHLNGDPMDVDAASASADADDDNDAPSPTVASEVEIVEVPERYDSMDVAVQTDIKTGPKTSTMYWKIDRERAAIYHSIFNPDTHPTNTNTLLTVGENLCRFYEVSGSSEHANQVKSVDEPSLPPNSATTASAWHPRGDRAVCAIDTSRELSDGRRVSEQQIFTHSRQFGTHHDFLFPPMLEPSGLILLLRYSPNADYLLVLRVNQKRGLAMIYNTSPGATDHRPIAWRLAEHHILGASWISETSFVVCGEHGLVEAYAIDNSSSAWEDGFTEDSISVIGLTKLSTSLPETDCRWEKLTSDGSNDTVALASINDARLIIGSTASARNSTIDFSASIDLPAQLTALAFQPSAQSISRRPSLLATTFEDGTWKLFTNSTTYPSSLTCALAYHLTDGPALALAWSHDGQYLAIGGTELVQIWDIDTLVQREDGAAAWTEQRSLSYEPVVTWRPDAAATKPRNGEQNGHAKEEPLSEPSLSWSADGERLGFAVKKQVCFSFTFDFLLLVSTILIPFQGRHYFLPSAASSEAASVESLERMAWPQSMATSARELVRLI